MVLKEVTVWPGGRVPLPMSWRIEKCHLWHGHEGLWIRGYAFPPQGGMLEMEVEPDLYLRDLRELDVDDPEEVFAFVRDHGDVQQVAWRAAEDAGVSFLHPDAIASSLRDEELADIESAKWGTTNRPSIASPRQVGHQLALVRDLTTLSLAITGQVSWEDAYAALHPRLIDKAQLIRHEELVTSSLLGHCLRDFHVSVIFGFYPDPWVLSESRLRLDAVLCLSLANDLADDAGFKRCASETCERFFTRHRGRAKQGKYHMTGVKYCSVECARAQKQREYRRRQRQKGAKP